MPDVLLPRREQMRLEELILWARVSGFTGEPLSGLPPLAARNPAKITALEVALVNEAYETERALFDARRKED